MSHDVPAERAGAPPPGDDDAPPPRARPTIEYRTPPAVGPGRHPPGGYGTGAYPAYEPAAKQQPPSSGGYPAYRPGAAPPPSAGYPAVTPPARPPVGGYGTGTYPAHQPRAQPDTGGYPAVAPRPTVGGGGRRDGRETARHTQPPARPQSDLDEVEATVAAGSDRAPKVNPDVADIGRSGFPRVGEELDGYRIRELLGQGNMGRIYRARDNLGRNVALKVIRASVASGEGLARFEREGQALAKIPRHKNVVSVHSTGHVRGMPYLVLDYVEGENLRSIVDEHGSLPPEQAAMVTEKLGRALEHVHRAGVMHRDVKPANIVIRLEDGEPVLTDFGLAGLEGAHRLTQTGDVLGTPLYMPPEQVLGLVKEVDRRSEVWSLGVLLYELVTGRLPFPGRTMLEVTQAITSTEPRPVTELNPDADPGMQAIVARALAKKKQDRYPSPAALADALRDWRKVRSERGRVEAPLDGAAAGNGTLILIAAVGLGVILALAAALFWFASSGAPGPPR